MEDQMNLKNLYLISKEIIERGIVQDLEAIKNSIKNGELLSNMVIGDDEISSTMDFMKEVVDEFESFEKFTEIVAPLVDFNNEYQLPEIDPEVKESFINIMNDIEEMSNPEAIVNSIISKIKPEEISIVKFLNSIGIDKILLINKFVKDKMSVIENISDNNDQRIESSTEINENISNEIKEESKIENLSKETTEKNEQIIENSTNEQKEKEEIYNGKYTFKEAVYYLDKDDPVSNKDWGEVDKDKIRKKIVELAEEDKEKARKLAEDIFLFVKCVDSPQCMKFPVAEVTGSEGEYKIKYNRKGLATAIAYLSYPSVKAKYSDDEIKSMINKAKRIYKEYFGDIPESLKSSKNVTISWDEILSSKLKSDDIIKFSENDLIKYQEFEKILNSLISMGIIDIDGDIFLLNDGDIDKITHVLMSAVEKIIEIKKTGSFTDNKDVEINNLKNMIKEKEIELEKVNNELGSIMNSLKTLQAEKEELENKMKFYSMLEKKYELVRNELINSNKGYLVESIDSIESEEEIKIFNKIASKIGNTTGDIRINNSSTSISFNNAQPNKKKSNTEDDFVDEIRKRILNIIN